MYNSKFTTKYTDYKALTTASYAIIVQPIARETATIKSTHSVRTGLGTVVSVRGALIYICKR